MNFCDDRYDAWNVMDFPSILGQLFDFLWEGQVCLYFYFCLFLFNSTLFLWSETVVNFCFDMMVVIWWISHQFLGQLFVFLWEGQVCLTKFVLPSLFSMYCLSKFVCPSLFSQFCLYLPLYDKTKPLWIFVMIWCLKFDGFPIYSRSIVCLFVRRPSLFGQVCFAKFVWPILFVFTLLQ